MRYTDYLKRKMDRLTSASWEQLLTAEPPAPPAPKTFLAICPCCRNSVVVELVANLRSAEPLDDLDDVVRPGLADDTQLELAALTRTDLVAV